jgi:hypothetical protein
VALKRADCFLTLRISQNLASKLSPPPVPHPLQQLIADNLPALSDHVGRCGILHDRNPLEWGHSCRFLVYLKLLLPPPDANVVEDGAGYDDFPGAFVLGSQGLQYGILLLNYPKDVLCGDRPDLREPGVEFRLGRVNKGLSVGVWFHENITDGVPRVPCHQEVPLPLNHRLHVGIFPNPGIVVGTLPVGVDVQDQVFVISNNLNVMVSI